MVRFRTLRQLALLGLLLTGCGRLGFEPRKHEVSSSDAPDGGEPGHVFVDPPDDPPDAVDEDGGPGAAVDAGPGEEKPRGGDGDGDAGVLPVEPDDAGSLPFEPDAGAPVDDADAGVPGPPPSSFACADFPGALGCSTFNSRQLSNAWYLDWNREGEEPEIYDGMLETQTYGSEADSYASVSFRNYYGGSIYFRMRVMFPSDGDLTSVNFITVGNYESDSDYGVELDAIDGRLAFNSSSDGWTYSDYDLPRDQWLCIDASIVLDRYGEMSVRVNGEDALYASDVDTVPQAGTALADVGIDWTRRGQEYGHVLVDEFVISRNPVPCP